MINLKKIDERDFVFINKPLSEMEDKAFSNFLKTRKAKALQKKKKKNKAFQVQ